MNQSNGRGEGMDPNAARYLTRVQTLFVEGQKNYRILFGSPVKTETLERREGITRLLARFAQGSRFALDLWARNTYGTVQWRCFVCQAIGPGEEGVSIPRVSPAARVLLHTKGAAESRLFLAWLRDLELEGIDLLKCPQETFEAAHFRLRGCRADRTPPQRLSGRL